MNTPIIGATPILTRKNTAIPQTAEVVRIPVTAPIFIPSALVLVQLIEFEVYSSSLQNLLVEFFIWSMTYIHIEIHICLHSLLFESFLCLYLIYPCNGSHTVLVLDMS